MSNIDRSQLSTLKQREDAAAAIEARKVRQDALDYLASTDWYLLRQTETGKPVPDEVTKARADAREAVT